MTEKPNEHSGNSENIDEDVLLISGKFLEQREYWDKKLSGDLSAPGLPPGPVEDKAPPGPPEAVDIPISPALSTRLLKVSKNSPLALYIALLTGVHILLYRYTGVEDTVTVSPLNKFKITPDTLNRFVLVRTPVRGDMGFKALLLEVRRTVLGAYGHQDYPFDKLLDTLGITAPGGVDYPGGGILCTLDSLHAEGNVRAIEAPLTFSFRLEGDRVLGGILCKDNAYEQAFVQRLAQHLAQLLEGALEQVTTPVSLIPMLSSEEKHQLLVEFMGKPVDFPADRTVPRLVETMARTRPHAPALACNGRVLTYGGLNREANRLARLLPEMGGAPGQPVGVLMERTVEMVVGILATWKMGAFYIPLDTRYPLERLKEIINDSGAVLLVTGAGGPDFSALSQEHDGHLNMVCPAEQRDKLLTMDDSDPDTGPAPADLAYVIYTSGSTGKPKGAMVEHTGMSNHILAKVEDLRADERSIVAQNASHTFDISVWQFFTALTVGGKTVIYPEETVLEPERFIRRLAGDRVTILETVPSYLSVMLDAPAMAGVELRRLAFMLVTGEAVKPGLLQRWFHRYPAVPVVNAYGPTEASDDITHHIMHEPPAAERVPIGKPLQNFHIYVVDPDGQPCPVGVKGEIWVSGPGVGRGYLKDPERTARVFTADPFREEAGVRLYKTGDLGMWRPEGVLDFFGRKDYQVKIRGFRIELEEIENRLLRVPGVKEAVVIDRDGPHGDRLLCAYLVPTGGESPDPAAVKEALARQLPDYMVPAHVVRMGALPLTPNGKIDRKALPEPGAVEEKAYIAPSGDMEHRLARVMEQVLARDRLSVEENFFEVGGDSIKAIQIASRMYGEGYKVEMRDIFDNPTIRELAPAVKPLERVSRQAPVTGTFPLSPVQARFFAADRTEPHHFNQAVALHSPHRFEPGVVRAVFAEILKHHDALRITFETGEDGLYRQENHDTRYPPALEEFDLRDRPGEASLRMDGAAPLLEGLHTSLDLHRGPSMKLGLFHFHSGGTLVITIHHLLVDGISWRILLEDIQHLFSRHRAGEPLTLPLKTDAYKSWCEGLTDYAQSRGLLDEKAYWRKLEETDVPAIQPDHAGAPGIQEDSAVPSAQLDAEDTRLLLTSVNEAFGTEINDILLAALGLAFKDTYGINRLLVGMESHGRENLLEEVNVNRTVGWFTAVFPMILDTGFDHDTARLIKEVKETVARVPRGGTGYGILKYLTPPELKEDITFRHEPRVGFNYLGQFDAETGEDEFRVDDHAVGQVVSPKDTAEFELDFTGRIIGRQLSMSLTYNPERYRPETAQGLVDAYGARLRELIRFCANRQTRELTPSDLTYPGLSVEALELLEQRHPVEDVYTLTPMQEGMYFHTLSRPDSTAYLLQFSYRLQGRLDTGLVQKSLDVLFQRHHILRTSFFHEGVDRTLQAVLRDRRAGYYFEDLRPLPSPEHRENRVRLYNAEDRRKIFHLGENVLMRVALFREADDRYRFTWTFHHILMDGWCLSLLTAEFFEVYTSFLENRSYRLPEIKPYRDYILWLEKRDRDAAALYWREYLEGYDAPAELPTGMAGETVKEGYRLEEFTLRLDEAETSGLSQLAGANRVTMNTVLQAAWGVLLGYYSGGGDAVFGFVVSGRPAAIRGIEFMIGLFINTVPVRVRFREDTPFNRLLTKLQAEVLESEPHQHFPLADIQSVSPLRQQLLNHILMFQNYPVTEQIRGVRTHEGERAGNVLLEVLDVEAYEHTGYDFNMFAVGQEQLSVSFSYNGFKYRRETVERTALHLRRILMQVRENQELPVKGISILSEGETGRILHELNGASAGYPRDKTIRELFTRQVEQRPDHVALVGRSSGAGTRGEHLTYRELDREARRLAGILHRRGAGRGGIAAILIEPSIQAPVGILAILTAGAAYLPIDPQHPGERIAYMLRDSKAAVLMTTAAYTGIVSAGIDKIFLENRETASPTHPAAPTPPAAPLPGRVNRPGDPAYVIYTSGTTGKPKGVMIEHRNVLRLMVNDRIPFDFSHHDVWTLFHSLAFDLSVWEMYGALLYGGKSVLVPRMTARDTSRFPALLEREHVTVLTQTPTAFYSLSGEVLNGGPGPEKARPLNLRYIILAGEALKPSLLKVWAETYPAAALINMYGITETTVYSTFKRIGRRETESAVSNIGRPLPTQETYVIGSHGRLCPTGVPGELWVGGGGVGRGYLNRPQLTAERFIPSPFKPGQTLYRSGDRVRLDETGDIEYLERIDKQVKIRGFRIELGEIEHRLLGFPAVKEAVVTAAARESTPRPGGYRDGGQYLCAYLVREKAGGGTPPDTAKLREYLARHLPDYMIPAFFMELPGIPLTSNGKVDYKQLPRPEIRVEEYTAPGSEIEETLTGLWGEVLSMEKSRISVSANFFEMGGNSLHVTWLHNKIKEIFLKDIPVVEMFRYTTIASLAEFITRFEAGKSSSDMDTLREDTLEGVKDSLHSAMDLFDEE